MSHNRLQVGVDVSKKRLDFALMRPTGELIERHQPFPNSLPGFERAKALLVKVMAEQGLDGIDLAAESTSYYWLPYFIQFSQDTELSGYEADLYLLNARWVHWFKKALSPDNKDDRTDPSLIAERLRTRKPATTWQYDPKWLKLRFLTRFYMHLNRSLTREKNLFQLYLFLAYNTYTTYRPFNDALGQTSQKLFRQPELLAELANLPPEELAEQLYELSGHHLHEPLKNAVPLQKAIQESFHLPDELAVSVQFILEQLMEVISDIEKRLHAVDAEITKLIKQDGYEDVWLLASIPGVGLISASGLAAEIGGLERFKLIKWDKQRQIYRQRWKKEIEDAIAKLAGLWWPNNDSGEFVSQEKRMSKEGNAYLRFYILRAADLMRQRIPSFAAYYQAKHAQSVKHKHKRAVVLTGRKALGLFVSLLYHRKAYQAEEAKPTIG